MKLNEPTQENLEFMVNAISNKLDVVNTAAMEPKHFDVEKYDDIKDIYDMICYKDNISVNEKEAIVSELGKLRK
ncbi:DUF1128 domain-containing protein [Alteribacillus iranensis]|uniref:Uncharacterized protein YfkK, UPF0435 family n=1 Tax=Alteribacillus iranensis TaxID=930128 RepID=A0A1I2A6W4_9BACI|nr:DUF1128 domain-containing protein [Alteribacillus iranensis]SFE39671.1 Uncharacterized protein YfkK, UPF0435 family [Alteribacillus iranensis]